MLLLTAERLPLKANCRQSLVNELEKKSPCVITQKKNTDVNPSKQNSITAYLSPHKLPETTSAYFPPSPEKKAPSEISEPSRRRINLSRLSLKRKHAIEVVKETEEKVDPPGKSPDQPEKEELVIRPMTDVIIENDRKPLDETEEQFAVPYYLENFKLIIDSIVSEEFYRHLFNADDLCSIEKFNSLSEDAQKLYVRLFQRKLMWHRKAKIVYPQIAEDLSESLENLVKEKLLEDESNMDDLSDALYALPAADVRNLAKSLQLAGKTSSSNTRKLMISAVLKHSQRSGISSFFGKKSDLKSSIMNRAKGMLGLCFRVQPQRREVFLRVFLLFGIHQARDDDEASAGTQLFSMLMSNIGRTKYPEYTIERKNQIFKDRISLIRLSEAVEIESKMAEALENKDFESATEIYLKVQEICPLEGNKHKDLPEFLRSLTAEASYVRILNYAVELLQFQKKYSEAVLLLEALIANDAFHLEYRGRWYDRLALNVDFHLKQHNKALDVIQSALSDERVQAGHRYSLWSRAQKLCHGSNKWLKKRWGQFKDDPMSKVVESPKVYIEGLLVSRSMQGANAVYLTSGEGKVTTRVEDVALEHYKNNGFPLGLHAEGSTFQTLFHIFFWDIVFMQGIPDVFYAKYQTFPLDLHSVEFYSTRKREINSRLKEIENATNKDLLHEVQDIWEKHNATLCLGLNWELFDDLEHLQGFVSCLGGRTLAGIFRRLAKHLKHVRSGVPDLVVWNVQSQQFKVVEVKGPGDRLSTKQILWLDYLIHFGVQAEVCHVRAVGSKRLKPTT
ncbi:hypothetical protein CAPTEDRAFT_224412 [Capitella teleta]|uniref:Fanconi-associated nuclease n=1 Tax=Capitella teleta TaxID=283909 RepID=R7U2X2_CAPTE|nr:hypothetical protein CAPTEDRAFT_224412 [Capitella teleta]|eukprot:ELT97530.1 hypothetical protein CAPTEDRAFT_224412 [Capitella teleta]